jgi:pimeloyl-ACP methyl ester carboxylesterase
VIRRLSILPVRVCLLGVASVVSGCPTSHGVAPAPVADGAPSPSVQVSPVSPDASSFRPDPPSSEAPVALGGTALLVAAGRIRDPDAPGLEVAMRAAYDRMRADEDDPASPVQLRTAPVALDLLVYEPKTPARSAVLFLHGYGGRFALPCWQVARAVATAGFATACPSIGTEGDWWSNAGERLVRTTVEALRAAGYARIVLAGLSNGGIGASRLAARMKGTFAGLVLLSGADPAAAPPGVPVLVVHGHHDAMSSAASAHAYARAAGGKYVDLDAGHFAMLRKADDVDRAVHDFVAAL